MKNYEIFIDGQQVEIGKFEDLDLAITLAIADSNEINARKKANTKTLKFPATNTNKLIFGFPEDFNSVVNIDQQTQPEIIIKADGAVIFIGVAKINTVSDLNGKVIYYSVNCTGTNGDWINRFGVTKISSLDYSDQNHTNDWSTIKTSETVATGREYVYDLIDRGEFTGQDYIVNGVKRKGVNIQDRFPALSIPGMIVRAYNSIGYTVVSDFIDGSFFQKLYWMFTNEELKHPETFNDTLLCSVESKSSPTKPPQKFINYKNAQNPSPYTWITLKVAFPYLNKLSDPSSSFGFNSKGEYFCRGRGKYTFRASIICTGSAFGYPNNTYGGGTYTGSILYTFKKINRYKDGLPYAAGPDASSVVIDRPTVNGAYTFPIAVIEKTFDLEYGDEIFLEAYYQYYRVLDGEFLQVDEITFSCTQVDGALGMGENQYVDWSYNLPNITKLDFIIGLKELFNLHFVADVGSRKIYIEPRDEFYNRTAEDWSNYLDNDKEIQTEFLGSSLAKIMRYRYAEDNNDKYVKLWESQNNTIFGAEDASMENAFAKEKTEEIVNSVFAPTWMDRCERIGLESGVIPRMWNAETVPKRSQKFKPRILYYDGLKTIPNSGFWRFNPRGDIAYQTYWPVTGTTIASGKRTTYPHFYSFDDTQVNENNLMYDDRHYSSGLYEKYYRNSQKLLDDGRRFTMFFYLNDRQIENIDFRKPKYIEKNGNGAYFILEKIDNYKSQDGVSTMCVLTKILPTKAIKALRYNTNRPLITYGSIPDLGPPIGTNPVGDIIVKGVVAFKRTPDGGFVPGSGEVVTIDGDLILPVYYLDSEGNYQKVLM